jgi:hypothetical protein
MALIELNSGETFTLATNANATIFGSGGGNEKIVAQGTPDFIVDQNIERVEFAGLAGDYTYQAVGNQALVKAGGVTVATVAVQDDADGTVLAFADGSASLKITGLNAMTLGGAAVPVASAGALSPGLNAADPSSATTKALQNVAGAGSYADSAATNTTYTYNIASGNYTADIAGFGAGDQLLFPAGFLSVVNANGADGMLDVQGAAGGNLVTIHLTGVPLAQDGAIFSVNSFNAVFGAGSLLTDSFATVEISGPATAPEGPNAGYVVTRAGDTSKAAIIDFALVSGGGATTADYGVPLVSGAGVTASNLTTAGGTLSFAAGVSTASIAIPILADALVETGETLQATLAINPSDASGSLVNPGKGAVTTALQDLSATFALSSDAAAGTPTKEGAAIQFTVTPSGPVAQDTTLTLNLVGGVIAGVNPASAGDFSPSSPTFFFTSGSSASQSVSVTVVSDGVAEGLEGYQANLADSGGTVAFLAGLINETASGGTYSLSTGVDNLAGSPVNDIFFAVNDSGGISTLSSGDIIDGGDGVDTLILKDFSSAGLTIPAGLSNVEKLEVTALDTTGTETIGLTGVTGLTDIVSFASAGDLIFKDIGNLVNLNITGGNRPLTLIYADAALAGSSDNQIVKLDSGNDYRYTTLTLTTASPAANSIESLTLNRTTSGGNFDVTLLTDPAQTSLKTIFLMGPGSGYLNSYDSSLSKVTTFDASTATGNISIYNIPSSAVSRSFVGGSGNDSFGFDFNLSSNDKVDGGGGTNDRISVNRTVTASDWSQVTSIETLELNVGGDYAQDLSILAGLTSVNVNFGNVVSLINLSNNFTVNSYGGSIDNLTMTLQINTAADSLTLHQFYGGVIGQLNDIPGLETFFLINEGDRTIHSDHVLAAQTISGYGTLSILSFDGVLLDASAFSGSLYANAGSRLAARTIIGGTGNDTILGSPLADNLNGKFGNSTIAGRGGADAIIVDPSSTKNILQYLAAGDSGATITDGGSTAALDIASGMSSGDVVDLSALGSFGATVGSDIAGASGQANLVRGVYSGSAFTVNGSGSDCLLVFDNDGLGANANYEAVVLVGYDGTTASMAANGLLTL